MEWNEVFPSTRQPSMDEIAGYIGGEAKELWQLLMEYMDSAIAQNLNYPIVLCAKTRWNVKFQKSGQALGTLYPEKNGFSVMIVISYKLDPIMESILPALSPAAAELYNNAGDYMKMGKWIMLRINDATTRRL